MSKPNPLAGLIGYGDSDEDSDDGSGSAATVPAQSSHLNSVNVYNSNVQHSNASVHPPPIPHCPWSACYDETSGFTYYWNHQTNAVTWEAPPEYLLALKLAQQQLATGSTEVSAEEWKLYQKVLTDKNKAKVLTKTPTIKPIKKETATVSKPGKHLKRKPEASDDEEKIELITSYSNTDSESESESPAKSAPPSLLTKPVTPTSKPVKVAKAAKKKKMDVVEYGPSLPSNQSYTMPIGPELPPELKQPTKDIHKEDKKPIRTENDEDQDEIALLQKLKDKAKLLEKLGGELPKDLKKMIKQTSGNASPAIIDEASRTSSIDTNIDDLLDEIEKKELPKAKKQKIDLTNSPKSGEMTPEPEIKPLFPSSKSISEEPVALFPSATNIQNGESEKKEMHPPLVSEKKGANLYIMDEPVENTSKRKLRISNSVLPERPKSEVPSYTTKYSEHIEGFSSERTGLGFSNDDTEETSKTAINYGNGLMFTKGETLNEQDNTEEDFEELMKLVQVKLNESQAIVVTPIQELYIQLQTLLGALRSGALASRWARSWLQSARRRAAPAAPPAPPGWSAAYCRTEGRYRYRRDADGLEQWEFPAEGSTDMDICTTPPHPGIEEEQIPKPPSAWPEPPPPPAWSQPPPPGEAPPSEEPPKPPLDELASFYSEIAEFENLSKPATPDPPLPPEIKTDLPREIIKRAELPRETKKVEDRRSSEKEVVKDSKIKKKTKVKISSSMGKKHKTVSTLVAKWQQVADEIHSD